MRAINEWLGLFALVFVLVFAGAFGFITAQAVGQWFLWTVLLG